MASDAADPGAAGSMTLVATGAETLAATALALWVSLRTGSPLIWLFLPLAILLGLRRSLSDHALDLRLQPPRLATHLWLGTVLLVVYALLHTAFALATGRHFVVPGLSWMLPVEVLAEVLVIGVPEEAFFRGYVQTRWNVALGTPWEMAGARVGPGLFVQAVAFAVCHLATGDWTRLRVFFFALLAGWLRERSGSILGPAIYHGVANVWYRLLLEAFH